MQPDFDIILSPLKTASELLASCYLSWTDLHVRQNKGGEPHLNSWGEIVNRAFIHQHQMEQVFLMHWDGLALFVDEHFHEQTNPVHNLMTREYWHQKKYQWFILERCTAALQSVPHKTTSISHHHLANNISGFSWAAIWQSNTV